MRAIQFDQLNPLDAANQEMTGFKRHGQEWDDGIADDNLEAWAGAIRLQVKMVQNRALGRKLGSIMRGGSGGSTFYPNPGNYIYKETTENGVRKINAAVVLEVHVKILDLVNTAESKQFARNFSSQRHEFNKIFADGFEYMYWHPDGEKIFRKDGRMELVHIFGIIPVIITGSIISSESEITDTDNVLILTNEITDYGAHPAGLTYNSVSAISEFTNRTASHEIFHQLGLMDEYISNRDGTFTARYKDNLMDLNGMNINNAQGAILLARVLMNIGQAKAQGIQAAYGGALNSLQLLKTKISY